MERFVLEMDKACDGWEMCALIGGVNLFYLTGSICDGLLLIRRGMDAVLWVRRDYARSVLESEFGDIRQMKSFRDIAGAVGALPGTLYLDTAHATLEWYGLLSKYMKFANVLPVDSVMLKTRAVKSDYELQLMRQAGSAEDRIIRNELPSLLREGISEAVLGAELFSLFMKNGHHGITRFLMRNSADLLGHIAFGESSLYPSAFNGASGLVGMCPAVPALGSHSRLLREGDLVYVDVCFGVEGYNVDRTRVYSYRSPQPEHVTAAQRHCLELERKAAAMLRPGVKPSGIYEEIINSVLPEYRDCFMGAPGHTVPFVGHSVGLYVDEYPAIAKGFDAPLECGMTIAIEPKIGVEGVGMVGIENTYLVTEEGGVSLTGEPSEIIVV